MADRLLGDPLQLTATFVHRGRAPPEPPSSPHQDVRDLAEAGGSLRVLEAPRPSPFRLGSATQPGYEGPRDPEGPRDSLVVTEPRRLAAGFIRPPQCGLHRRCWVVLNPPLELDETSSVVDA